MAAKRVANKKVQYDGLEFDSREELRYYQLLVDDSNVSCIHRQVRLCLIKPLYVLVSKALKTKIKWVRRSLVKGHYYTADFVFFEKDKLVICDVKSEYTASLREFSITMKNCIARIVAHNLKRHGGEAKVIFRKAIYKNSKTLRIVDYPADGDKVIYE